jgi:AI-2 transport protein TqsA
MVKSAREIMLRENRIIIGLLGILTVIAVGFVLYQIRSIILPFALAIFLSYVLNPVIQFFEDRKIPTFLAILLALFLTFLVLNLFGLLIYSSVKSFAVEFPKYEQRLSTIFFEVIDFFRIPREVFNPQTSTGDKLRWLDSIQHLSLNQILLNTLGSILNFMSNTVLVLLFLLFIFIGRNQVVKKIGIAFNPETSERLTKILKNINKQIQNYLIAKGLISLATGLLYFIILYFFGVEFAIIWGLLAFLLNFIPNIGSVIATVLPLSIALIQFDSLTTLLWLTLLLVGVQVILGNIIDPRLVGHSVNLSPLVVLFSLMFWGWLWGIVGMFLSIPISVVIKIFFENVDSLRFISIMMSGVHKST